MYIILKDKLTGNELVLLVNTITTANENISFYANNIGKLYNYLVLINNAELSKALIREFFNEGKLDLTMYDYIATEVKEENANDVQ